MIAYYDFGIIGTALFAFIIGLTAAAVSILVRQKKNPMTYMFYGQIAIYLGLAFFTTWFSIRRLVLAGTDFDDVLVCRISQERKRITWKEIEQWMC